MIALKFCSHQPFTVMWTELGHLGIFHSEAVLLCQRDTKTLLLLLNLILCIKSNYIFTNQIVEMLSILLFGTLLLIHQKLNRWVREIAIEENAKEVMSAFEWVLGLLVEALEDIYNQLVKRLLEPFLIYLIRWGFKRDLFLVLLKFLVLGPLHLLFFLRDNFCASRLIVHDSGRSTAYIGHRSRTFREVALIVVILAVIVVMSTMIVTMVIVVMPMIFLEKRPVMARCWRRGGHMFFNLSILVVCH